MPRELIRLREHPRLYLQPSTVLLSRRNSEIRRTSPAILGLSLDDDSHGRTQRVTAGLSSRGSA